MIPRITQGQTASIRLVLCCVMLSACARPAGEPDETQFPESIVKQVRVNLILDISPDPSGEGDLVATDRAGVLRVIDADLRPSLDWHLAKRLPATVEYDSGTGRISSVSSAPTDVIISLSPVEEGADRVIVQLMKRQTLTYLATDNPRFASLHELLASAFEARSPVALGILPAGFWIEDVRVNDWH